MSPGRRPPSAFAPAPRSTRRKFLLGTAGVAAAGTALLVGWSLLPVRQRLQRSTPLQLPTGQLGFNGWVAIGTDDMVTVMVPKSEMGQGVLTSLAMVLADELDADWSQVRTAHPSPDAIYNNIAAVVDGLPFQPDANGLVPRLARHLSAKTMREIGQLVTGGSTSVKDLWLPMRQAGASARAMLVAAAAKGWGVPPGECSVRKGRVLHEPSQRSMRFGDLAARAAALPLPENPPLKTAAQFKLIGQPLPRHEAAAKHDGSARFGIDTVQPGLHHASLLLCPTLGGSVASFDDRAASAMPGVVQVLAVPPLHGGTGGVAVIASTPWQAMAAVKAVTVQWDHGPAAGLDTPGIQARLKAALDSDDGFNYLSRGDAAAALQEATKTLTAEYSAPLLAHVTLEPQNATVLYLPDAPGGGRASVWAPTQVPGLARWAAARVLGLPTERVGIDVTLLGGGFGRRLEVDTVAQAAHIARALPGKPVLTTLTREQDSTHDFYRPPCVARYAAGFDAQGQLVAWQATSAGPSIVHQYLQRQFGLPGAGPDKTTVEGAFDQPYEWPNAQVRHQIVPLPVPIGFWRSVGHSHQAFFKESFIDEAAHAAGQDPVAFRLALLKNHPRHAAVLRLAAQTAGWGQPLAPAADGAPRARGVALHQSFGSIVAQVAEISLDPQDNRRIRVHRVVVAIDCGTVVNPNGVRQQMEGAVIFGLAAALDGEVTLVNGQVQQTNMHQLGLLRGADCPQIDTQIVPSTEPPEGVGEPGTPPVAPAVANALFALNGRRLRSLPLRLA